MMAVRCRTTSTGDGLTGEQPGTLYDQTRRLHTLEPCLAGADAVRLGEQLVLLGESRQRREGRAAGIVGPQQGFLTVQNWWIGSWAIVRASHDAITEIDTHCAEQGRKGNFVKGFIGQERDRVALKFGDVPVWPLGSNCCTLNALPHSVACVWNGRHVQIECTSDTFAGNGRAHPIRLLNLIVVVGRMLQMIRSNSDFELGLHNCWLCLRALACL